jgi:hypothetical protein
MALILKKKKSNYSSWYEKNKQRLSEKRKKRYAEDSEYRKRAREASRRYRGGERTPMTPPAHAPFSFAEAAKCIDVGESTLREWHKEQFFPEPKRHNGRRLWFSNKQILLLKKLKDRVHGKRRWYMKVDRFKVDRFEEVIASTWANWD